MGVTWRWAAPGVAALFAPDPPIENETFLFGPYPLCPSGWRRYALYFPLRTIVTSLGVGIPAGTSIKAYKPNEGKPRVLVWGSAITQGSDVQNAGLAWPSHLGRVLSQPVLNFGFAGACGMQVSVARALASLDPKPAAF